MSIQESNHSISLQQAVEMTTLYRETREVILAEGYSTDILPLSETFNAEAVTNLIKNSGAVGFRIYYGMSADLNIHAILVGVNDKGEDILPNSDENSLEDTGGDILEDSLRCPFSCPPESPLN